MKTDTKFMLTESSLEQIHCKENCSKGHAHKVWTYICWDLKLFLLFKTLINKVLFQELLFNFLSGYQF